MKFKGSKALKILIRKKGKLKLSHISSKDIKKPSIKRVCFLE